MLAKVEGGVAGAQNAETSLSAHGVDEGADLESDTSNVEEIGGVAEMNNNAEEMSVAVSASDLVVEEEDGWSGSVEMIEEENDVPADIRTGEMGDIANELDDLEIGDIIEEEFDIVEGEIDFIGEDYCGEPEVAAGTDSDNGDAARDAQSVHECDSETVAEVENDIRTNDCAEESGTVAKISDDPEENKSGGVEESEASDVVHVTIIDLDKESEITDGGGDNNACTKTCDNKEANAEEASNLNSVEAAVTEEAASKKAADPSSSTDTTANSGTVDNASAKKSNSTDEKKKSSSPPIKKEALSKLIDNLDHKDEKVAAKSRSSLLKILETHIEPVVSQIIELRRRNYKMTVKMVSGLLKTIDQALTKNEIMEDTAKKLTTFALSELTRSPHQFPRIQNAAMDIILVIGSGKYFEMVLENLLKHTRNPKNVHFMIYHCLGKLAKVKVDGMLTVMKSLLTALLMPDNVDVKEINEKQAQLFAIRSFCEVLILHPSGKKKPSKEVKDIESQECIMQDFVDDITVIYNQLFYQWLHSKDIKINLDILETLSTLGALLAKIEKPKLGGSGRKRLAILMKQGIGVDEAKILAQRPMSELEELYAPKRRKLWTRALYSSTKKKYVVERGGKVYQTAIDYSKFNWKRKAGEQSSSPAAYQPQRPLPGGNPSERRTEEGSTKLSGAGKKRLNVLLQLGLDINEAKIKARKPFSQMDLNPQQAILLSQQIQQNKRKTI